MENAKDDIFNKPLYILENSVVNNQMYNELNNKIYTTNNEIFEEILNKLQSTLNDVNNNKSKDIIIKQISN